MSCVVGEEIYDSLQSVTKCFGSEQTVFGDLVLIDVGWLGDRFCNVSEKNAKIFVIFKLGERYYLRVKYMEAVIDQGSV
jgi:hypothetical protein